MMARILLAEDDREIANLERDYLEMSGHEVVIAPDGEEAMKRINEEKFDLLILDIMMPKRADMISAVRSGSRLTFRFSW